MEAGSKRKMHETLDRALQAVEDGDLDAARTALDEARKPARKPGRFRGQLPVGPEFFEPLTEDELKEFTAE